MSNTIRHFLGFERLRDGGSLIASFQSQDSCEYWVMFPVANFDQRNPEFKSPVLVNRTTGIVVNLSLNAVEQWLLNLEPYHDKWLQNSEASKENETKILKEMLSLCNRNN